MPTTELICPNCREALESSGRVLQCLNGHSFDVAREGYVNLLPGKRRVGAAAGDTAEMVASRRAFLRAGYYRDLAEAMAKAVCKGLGGGLGVVADIGCGEGYYLDILMKNEAASGVRAYGTDVSKPAIVAAAKAYPQVQFVVADTNILVPLADGSVDILMNVFAPRNAAEFARVVRPDGRLVVAIPAEGHLASLRARFRLLAIEHDKAAKVAAQLSAFDLQSTQRVSAKLDLDGAALSELLEMTPNAWYMDEATRRELGAVTTIAAEAAFEVLVFTRRG